MSINLYSYEKGKRINIREVINYCHNNIWQ